MKLGVQCREGGTYLPDLGSRRQMDAHACHARGNPALWFTMFGLVLTLALSGCDGTTPSPRPPTPRPVPADDVAPAIAHSHRLAEVDTNDMRSVRVILRSATD